VQGKLNVLSGQQAEDEIKTLLEVSYYHVKDDMKCLLSSRECQEIEASRLRGCRAHTPSLRMGRKERSTVLALQA